ncbi:MAG: serine/threonine protein kinase, partial [Myxococcales bacterium]|nr:serine/threonine protein kinase [Myxococcales bacterium]
MERCPHCGQTHGPDNHFCGVTGQPLDLGPRLLGQVLLDRFEVKSLVGEGPLAVVLGGIDKQADGRRVAIKMLHPRFARDAAATERFLSEARRVGELGHPGLAPVYAVGRDPGGAPLVVREFLDGVCLARFVRERGPLPVELATYIVRSILAALQAVHTAGLYNGDLTADDVFLTSGADGVLLVKVLDFGEAHLKRALVAGGLAGPEATRWWAPEQKRSGIVNDRSDIFAVGAMLYLAVTGRVPYPDGIPPAPAVIAIPENPSALVPSVNRKIDIVVRRAMSLLPTDRYPSVTAFSEALAPFAPAVPPKFAETVGAPAKVVPAPAVLPVGIQPAP